MRDSEKLDILVAGQFPAAESIAYSCVDDPADVVIWQVRNANGRLLWNWLVAVEESWPGLGEAVEAFAVVARALPDRGDGLTYRLGSGGVR